MAQQTQTTPTRNHALRQARRHGANSRAAAAAHPVEPETCHAVCGFSLFTHPTATRTARAAFRFDTGHSF